MKIDFLKLMLSSYFFVFTLSYSFSQKIKTDFKPKIQSKFIGKKTSHIDYLLSKIPHQECSNPYYYLDSIAITFNPKDYTIDTLVKYCNSTFNVDSQKIRFYFRWIASKIAYDTFDSASKKEISSKNIAEILKGKKAICHGYSILFDTLCFLTKIPSIYVGGFTHKSKNNFYGNSHAWNVVKYNGKWCNIDVTWAAGGVDSINIFHKSFNNEYFITEPKLFLNSHFPEDPIFQLQTDLLTFENFEKEDFTDSIKIKVNFNFEDSINQFYLFPNVNNSLRRMVLFNSRNERANQNLIYLLLKQNTDRLKTAFKTLNKYYALKLKAYKDIRKFISEKEIVLKLIDEANDSLKKVEYSFILAEKFVFSIEENTEINTKIQNLCKNLDLTKSSLLEIENEYEFLKRIFTSKWYNRNAILNKYNKIVTYD